jgi:chromosome segregation ATPase
MDSVRQIAQRFGIAGVHGPLYSLFEVDDNLRTAVEVTAGGR